MAKSNKKGPINTLVEKLLISMDPEKSTEYNLQEKGNEFKNIINRQLELSKGVSGGSIMDFYQSIMQEEQKSEKTGDWSSTQVTSDIMEYVNKNMVGIAQDFSTQDRNRYLQYRDYQFVTAFIPKIDQALRMILTHIVSADDLTNGFKRRLDLGSALSKEQQQTVTLAIEKFEQENKLLYKLENIVYKTALFMGEYYVYAVSYKELFTDYAAALAKARAQQGNAPRADKKDKKKHMGYATESVTISDEEYSSLSSTFKPLGSAPSSKPLSSTTFSGLYGSSATFTCYTDDAPIFLDDDEEEPLTPSLESFKEDFPAYCETMCAALESVGKAHSTEGSGVTMAGVADVAGKPVDEGFNVTGTYIKFISPRNVIPVEVLGNIVGYIYMSSNTVDASKQALNLSSININGVQKKSPVEEIAASLADAISKKFSDKFVAANVRYKKLMADCILATGVTNVQYKVQFIPANKLIHFKIDEDEKGRGQSILKSGMHKSKILAAVYMRKVLNYLNKSGDKTIITVGGGNADYSKKNQAMNIIRNLQEQNIVVSDLMGDCNNIFHKYAADSYMLMPRSKTGNRLVEFEKMDGQNIDMNTEWEKEQENQILISMGMPPLLLDTHDQADFARAFTSQHIGFTGNIGKWDGDFETPTTELYKVIIENLDIGNEIKDALRPVFKFGLIRPKFSSTQSTVEAINQAMQNADNILNLVMGEDVDDATKPARQSARLALVKDMCSYLPWNNYEALIDESLVRDKAVQDEVKETDASTSMGDEDIF